uniref:Uncharacterized protein n=1 Tax=Astyanax mexicanus TaxID=7994 RepID=A0A3B1KDY6_ASTMX
MKTSIKVINIPISPPLSPGTFLLFLFCSYDTAIHLGANYSYLGYQPPSPSTALSPPHLTGPSKTNGERNTTATQLQQSARIYTRAPSPLHSRAGDWSCCTRCGNLRVLQRLCGRNTHENQQRRSDISSRVSSRVYYSPKQKSEREREREREREGIRGERCKGRKHICE